MRDTVDGINEQAWDRAMAGPARKRYPTRGFGSMDQAKRREIASAGGRAAHVKGVAHEWTSAEAKIAGRKGGETQKHRRAVAPVVEG